MALRDTLHDTRIGLADELEESGGALLEDPAHQFD